MAKPKMTQFNIVLLIIIVIIATILFIIFGCSESVAPIEPDAASISMGVMTEENPTNLVVGTAWYNDSPSTNWPNQGFYLHGEEFLRVRTAEPSSVEGYNRAMIEVAFPSDPIIGATLHLSSRNSMEPIVELHGYPANGVIETTDAEIATELIDTFSPVHRESTDFDIFDFVHRMKSQGNGYAGFRLQLADEISMDPGMLRRSEWQWQGGLGVQPEKVSIVFETCYADCDQSTNPGFLDIFDFLCWQDKYVNQDPYACDCDTSTGPGVCDTFDFLCFQNEFTKACK